MPQLPQSLVPVRATNTMQVLVLVLVILLILVLVPLLLELLPPERDLPRGAPLELLLHVEPPTPVELLALVQTVVEATRQSTAATRAPLFAG